MKPDFQKVFWIVNNEMFKPRVNRDWMPKDVADNIEYVSYQKVIPVYVKCVSDMYDGTTEFDISPVDLRDGKTKHWGWSRAIQDDAIGKTVFETEEEAIEYFNKKYSEDQRKTFSEKHELRSMYR
jgi:hypothetical protein